MTSLTVFQRGTQVVRLVQVVYARHPMVEWGQDDADSTMLGDTALGCTQTELQVADFLEHGRILSLDRISALAGYRDSDRAAGHGMSTNQLKTAIEALELPLEVVYDLPYDELIHSVREMGPALVSCQYAWYPQKHDVNGATGEPNGYCDRAGGREHPALEP